MKCLPAAKVPQARGLLLHDWHAEVIAIRAFNRLLLDECLELAACPHKSSSVLRRRYAQEVCESQGLQPFTICENIKIHMYCSDAPCGDASMELVMDAQQDATPWPLAVPVPVAEGDIQSLPGREYFSELGIVRRKPCTPILLCSIWQ
jgi:tRNA-specific adenosine deaminase 1